MVMYTKKGKSQYARKGRRITKYGNYKRPNIVSNATVPRYVKGRRGIQNIPVPRFRNPFKNDSELVQLTYYQSIYLDGGSDTTTSWPFSFNSLYDPDQTIGGHQPLYYDNYAALYGKYKVSFSKMTVTVVNHNVNTAVINSGGTVQTQPNYSYRLAIVRDASTTDLPSSMTQLIEQNATNVKWRYVAPTLNGRLPKLSMKCAPHKQAGVSYSDDTLSSATNSQPSNNIKGVIVISSADGYTNPPEVYLTVKIRYYVKFFDRVVSQSQN